MQVSNSNVRQNALHLLLDLFPLEDPDVTKEAKDSLLDKQFYLLDKLILDDCPDVRAVAVEGSCRVLHLFWEVIPSSTITNILKKITNDLSHDTCTEVRSSTVKGIIYLLDNPQSHEIMKVLLPRLGGMFTDHAVSVRVAVADLLLAVRDIRTIQFHKVVSLDTLLSSLANDHPNVAQRITRLLIPSYFPFRASHKEACSRCVALIKRSPKAGARFCEFAFSEGSSSKSLIELLKVFSGLAVSTKDLNVDQVDGFFVASANICRSLLTGPSGKAALCEIFSGSKLKCLFAAAGSPSSKNAVLAIASVVSPDMLEEFHGQFMTLVTDCVGLSENLELQSVVQTAHKLILSFGWFEELFESLANILHSIASGYAIKFGLEVPQQGVQTGRKKRVKLSMKSPLTTSNSSVRDSRVSQFNLSNAKEDFAIAAAVAWQVKVLLKNVDTRMAILRYPSLQNTFLALRTISQVGIEQCMQWESLDASPIMAYMSFAIHISCQNVKSTGTESLKSDKNNASQCSSPSLEVTHVYETYICIYIYIHTYVYI
ncbi:putative armadillo-like helical protein [Dioscorea sansibarensis]